MLSRFFLQIILGMTFFSPLAFGGHRGCGKSVSAKAKIRPLLGSQVQGEVSIRWAGRKRMKVVAEVQGLKPNQEFGFHIHENGSCEGKGLSAGRPLQFERYGRHDSKKHGYKHKEGHSSKHDYHKEWHDKHKKRHDKHKEGHDSKKHGYKHKEGHSSKHDYHKEWHDKHKKRHDKHKAGHDSKKHSCKHRHFGDLGTLNSDATGKAVYEAVVHGKPFLFLGRSGYYSHSMRVA